MGLINLREMLEAKAHKTPSGVKACVVGVMDKGDKKLSQAFAICQAQNKKTGLRDATPEEVAKFEKILKANRKSEAQSIAPEQDILAEVNLGPLQTNVARVCAHAEKAGYKVRRSGDRIHFAKGEKKSSLRIDAQGRYTRQGKTLKQVAAELELSGEAVSSEGEAGAEGGEV